MTPCRQVSNSISEKKVMPAEAFFVLLHTSVSYSDVNWLQKQTIATVTATVFCKNHITLRIFIIRKNLKGGNISCRLQGTFGRILYVLYNFMYCTTLCTVQLYVLHSFMYCTTLCTVQLYVLYNFMYCTTLCTVQLYVLYSFMYCTTFCQEDPPPLFLENALNFIGATYAFVVLLSL